MTETPEHARLTRREALERALLGFGLAAATPLFLNRTLRALARAAADPRADRVLVVLQMSGGNDGLSTVVPWAMDDYHRVRSAPLAIPARDVLPLDDVVGLHPGLAPLKPLFDEGRLAVLQGVGYPNPNRSHFKSMEIWHTGDPTLGAGGRGELGDSRHGWLGRAGDAAAEALAAAAEDELDVHFAVSVGQRLPPALNGRILRPVAFADPAAYRFRGSRRVGAALEQALADSGCEEGEAHGGENVDFLARVAVDARASSARVREATSSYRTPVEYGRSRLARDLRHVAAMLAAGLPTRVFYLQQGGYDTHAGQRGRHDQLLRDLAQALAAFQQDLARQDLARRVVLLTFSEFGRRVAGNASGGTDHGAAGPMFLMGEAVRGGVVGAHPSLTDLDRGDLRHHTDFRAVYATVLDRWLALPAEAVLGRPFAPLPVL